MTPAQAVDPSHAAAPAVAATSAAASKTKAASVEAAAVSTDAEASVQDASLEISVAPTTAEPVLDATLPADSGSLTDDPSVTLTPPVPATLTEDLDKLRKLAAAPRAQKCLTTAIYFEARGESKRGQTAVAQVIINRAMTKGFPHTICGVVYQGSKRKTGCQFSFTCDKIPDKIKEQKAWDKAETIARAVLSGKAFIPELLKATHYHATYVSPRWAPKMKKLAKIGVHIFYDA